MFKKLLFSAFIMSALCSVSVFAENIELLPEADSKTYTTEDVQNMDLQTMCIARNEIYAKHGRKFVSQELQEWYNNQEWYEGTTEPDDFKEESLNETEKANVSMLWELELSQTDGKGYPVDDISHKKKAETVDQLGQEDGWDYSAVYTYLGMDPGTSSGSFDILKGLEVYSSSGMAVMDADNFYMTIPTNPKVGYSQEEKDSFTIYYVTAQQSGFGGVVVTIKAYDIGDTSYNQLPSYQIAGANDKKLFIAIYPTDVQFNQSDPTQTNEYGTLLNWARSLDYNSSTSSFRGETPQSEQSNDGSQNLVTADQGTNQQDGVIKQAYDALMNNMG